MNGANKLLQDLGGRSVLSRTVGELRQAGFASILAVTGFQSPLVEQELDALDVPFVENKSYETGMHSSIRCGVESMTANGTFGSCGFFAVCLGDQPLMRADDYAALIEAAKLNPSASLIVPIVNGERGQPTLISRKLCGEILAHADDDRGCRYLFDKHPMVAVDLTSTANHFAFHDVDTPEALTIARGSL